MARTFPKELGGYTRETQTSQFIYAVASNLLIKGTRQGAQRVVDAGRVADELSTIAVEVPTSVGGVISGRLLDRFDNNDELANFVELSLERYVQDFSFLTREDGVYRMTSNGTQVSTTPPPNPYSLAALRVENVIVKTPPKVLGPSYNAPPSLLFERNP
ncbi:hypothetical protein GOV07_00205 [Candidatus Woesearchaeota archaeon]|nr:hypothetical protein [Candidatus Woesearchaeota archaeon]